MGHESDPLRVLGMIAIQCQQGLGFLIPVGHDMHLGGFVIFA